MNKRLKVTGILAFSVYIILVGILFSYFNHHSKDKSLHFVSKNSDRVVMPVGDIIPVSISKSTATKKEKHKDNRHKADKAKEKPTKKVKTQEKSVEKKVEKPKEKPKEKKLEKPLEKPLERKVEKPKEKKIEKTKEKPKEKKVEKKVEKPKEKTEENAKESTSQKENKKEEKKESVKNLFDKVSDKAPEKSTNENKGQLQGKNEEKKDKGLEDKYLAKIEETLQDWPAQSEFAGESAIIRLWINSDGSFKFLLLSPSNNPDFNAALIQYLEQLQRFGFDSHHFSKVYEIDITFIAKD